MTGSSHLRLVFPKADDKVLASLKTMVNPYSKRPLFIDKNERTLPDGRVELLSCEMPSLMTDTAPAVIDRGQFPHLEGYLLKSFDGEHGIYGQEAGMRVELTTKVDEDAQKIAKKETTKILQKFACTK